jgi:CheY-like chemotaxis protein
VAITAFAMPGDKEKILEAGCRDYIAKPIHIPDLLNKVAEYLGSEPSPVADGENHG